MSKYFKKIIGVGNGNYVYLWKSKGLSDEDITSITASNYIITPELNYFGTKIRVKFNESYLKQNKIIYNHGAIVNIYIVYEISKSSYPTLENCFLGQLNYQKNNDIDMYKYSGYGIPLDSISFQ